MATSRITLLVDGRPVTVNETGTERQLYEEVARIKSAQINTFYLTYGGRPIEVSRDGNKRLKEYHFQNMEALVFTERSHGGPLGGHEQAAKLRELQRCETKTIGCVAGCPNIRACRRCGTLKYHQGGCKHMSCRCGCNFCFICLSLQNSDGTWPCGSSSDNCSVASRQTSLPNS